ncbi:MAG TPA: hypothetical protein VD837_08585 [Terriglobales bacterium]|nr:hypothetical protein [Terriglobales bacterium]
MGRVPKLVLIIAIWLSCAAAQEHQPISAAQQSVGTQAETLVLTYTVTLADAARNHVHVKLSPIGPDGVVQLPVWNALYQVRDFAQFVQSVRATDRHGRPVAVRKIDKTTWSAPGANAIEYDIVLNTPGAYSAQINREHAFLNLAQVLMYVPGPGREWPIALSFEAVPSDWQIATVLKRSPGNPKEFNAPKYDALVDAPVEIGRFREIAFEDGGAKYRIVIDALDGDYDAKKVRENVRKIVRAGVDWMGDRPCAEYLFIYHFPREYGGGGMEHACSTAIDVPAGRMSGTMSSFNSVTAHEFFHLWNVKRIRPQSLEPVDYTREQYTRALWFSEGVTSTVDGYILLRAGLIDESGYLKRLAAEIGMLQSRPAHLTQSAEESSLDTWFDKYPFYRRPERSISYYNKGEVLGAMLDLAIRESTGGTKSLRDVFHWMNENYARRGRFFDDSEGVLRAVEAVTGKEFDWFFRAYVAGTDDIPFDRFLNTAGLRLGTNRRTVADAGFATSRNFDGPPLVTDVYGDDAAAAGLRVGDAIVAVNGKRNVNVGDEMASGSAGQILRLTVRNQRTSREQDTSIRVGSREAVEFYIAELEQSTPEQKRRRAEWLTGPRQQASVIREKQRISVAGRTAGAARTEASTP